MLKVLYRTAAVAAIASLPFSASALGITVQTFTGNASGLSDARNDFATTRGAFEAFVTEDFESFTTVGQIGKTNTASLSTSVGTFTTLNGKDGNGSTAGNGTTAIDQFNDDEGPDRGNNLAIRQDGDLNDNGGRKNTSGDTGTTDNTYLDSNDTRGIRWDVSVGGGVHFTQLLFMLTDVGDQGRDLVISASDVTESFTIDAASNANGRVHNVLVTFSEKVNFATVDMLKNGTNDGFGLDNATAAVPLPAAAWLLLGVSGALVAAKRRSARKPA